MLRARAGPARAAGARRRARPRLARRPPGDRAGRRHSASRSSRRSTPPRPAGTPAGSRTPLNQQVHSVEWWLAHRADTVITCSPAMRAEVAELFDLDPDAVAVLHNGIDAARWRAGRRGPRAERDAPGGAPSLLYFGRLEYEKGVHDLIAALPRDPPRPPRHPAAGRRHRHRRATGSRTRPGPHRVRRSVRLRSATCPTPTLRRPARRRRRGRAAQPLRAVRDRRAGGGRGRRAAGRLDGGRAGRGGASTARPGCRSPPGDVPGLAGAR